MPSLTLLLLGLDDCHTFNHGPDLSAQRSRRKIQAVIGCDNNPLRINIGECAANARGNDLRRFNYVIGRIEFTRHVRVTGKTLQD